MRPQNLKKFARSLFMVNSLPQIEKKKPFFFPFSFAESVDRSITVFGV